MKYQIELTADNETELAELMDTLNGYVGGKLLETVVLKPVFT